MRNSTKVHFEQIPVDTVKRMIAEAAKKEMARHAGISQENLSTCGSDATGLGETKVQMAGSFTLEVDASDLQYPEWQRPLQAALLELDPAKLGPKLDAAESAIFERLQANSQGGVHHPERVAMEDALSSLRVVKRETLRSPE
jgi:hypothetical protein